MQSDKYDGNHQGGEQSEQTADVLSTLCARSIEKVSLNLYACRFAGDLHSHGYILALACHTCSSNSFKFNSKCAT